MRYSAGSSHGCFHSVLFDKELWGWKIHCCYQPIVDIDIQGAFRPHWFIRMGDTNVRKHVEVCDYRRCGY